MLGSLHDAIDRLDYSYKWEKLITHKTKVLEYYFDDITLEKLNMLLNDNLCIKKEIINNEYHCSDCGGYTSSVLTMTYDLTDEEKQTDLEKCLAYRKSAVNFINKCLERNPNEKEYCMKLLNIRNLKINLK